MNNKVWTFSDPNSEEQVHIPLLDLFITLEEVYEGVEIE
jgi:hypothetical protein